MYVLLVPVPHASGYRYRWWCTEQICLCTARTVSREVVREIPRPGPARRRYGSDIYTPTETFLMSPPTCTLVVAHSWQKKKNTSDSPCRLPSLSTWLVGTWQTVYLRSLPPSLLCWHVAASTSTSRARSGQSRALSLNATQRSAPWIDEQYWPRTPTVLVLPFPARKP